MTYKILENFEFVEGGAEESYANLHPATKAFMDEVVGVFLKYGLVIVPTYEGETSMHDALRVIPLDAGGLEYFRTTGVVVS